MSSSSSLPDTLSIATTFVNEWLQLPISQSHIQMNDPTVIINKVAQILNDGPNHLHIISDFDMTMTKYWVNNARGPSSHAILNNSSTVSSQFKETTNAMYDKYYPLEIDPTIPKDIKYGIMEQWWREAHLAILTERIHESQIDIMATETQMTWRSGLNDLLQLSLRHNIYFLVFSAGIKNVIKATLKKDNLLYPHVHIQSNEMYFDSITGICTNFSEPPIHTLNKAEIVLAHTNLPPDSQEARHALAIKDRNNVILMGDSLGDANMADGIQHSVCLRIGYCNMSPDIWLPKFMNMFDIVILDDVGFDWVIALLKLFDTISSSVTTTDL